MKKSVQIIITVAAVTVVLVLGGLLIHFKWSDGGSVFEYVKEGNGIERHGNSVYKFKLDDRFYMYETLDSKISLGNTRVRLYGEFDKDTYDEGTMYCDIDGYDMKGFQVGNDVTKYDTLNLFENTELCMKIKTQWMMDESETWNYANDEYVYYVIIDENLTDVIIIIENTEDKSRIYLCNWKR